MNNIKVYADGILQHIIRGTFPAGESLISVGRIFPKEVTIELNFKNNNDLVDLMLLVDAIRRQSFNVVLTLKMPYLPYARQDRVCNGGESLSIKVIADLINSLKFDKVLCYDIHSDVGVALINNLVNIPQYATGFLYKSINSLNVPVIVSPDAGANKKVMHIAGCIDNSIVFADKVRDVRTGQLSSFKVHSTEHIGNRDFLIVDDILDGGGTFIGLAKELRKLTDGKICLYVTHGIFSKGADIFHGLIDKIFVVNLMNDSIKGHPLIQEM